METPIQIAISPSARNHRPEPPKQMSWIATGMATPRTTKQLEKTKQLNEN